MPLVYKGKPGIRRSTPRLTPGSEPVPALGLEPSLALGPGPAPAPLQDDLFHQFIQAYIEDRWNPTPLEVREREDTLDRPLKVRNTDL